MCPVTNQWNSAFVGAIFDIDNYNISLIGTYRPPTLGELP